MIKCIFVGDEPNSQARTRTPFVHAKCAERLSQWVDYLVGDEDYVVVNQCDVSKAQLYDYIRENGNVKFIALGNRASFKLANCFIDHFKLPHPSGRNRQLNDKVRLLTVLRTCKEFLG